MAKNNVADLLSVGSLFTTQAERDEAQRETVRDIPLEEISDFPNIVGKDGGDSQTQVRRYIRLTHLIPDILDLVDNSVLKEKDILQIALRPAVELSYLSEEEQQDLVEIMESEDCTPFHAQAIKMRQFSQEDRLDANVLLSIMQEEKPNQVDGGAVWNRRQR